MKLTPAQVRILGVIARTGDCSEPGTKTTNPYRSVVALEQAGLVIRVLNRTSHTDPLYALTEAGKAILRLT